MSDTTMKEFAAGMARLELTSDVQLRSQVCDRDGVRGARLGEPIAERRPLSLRVTKFLGRALRKPSRPRRRASTPHGEISGGS